MWLVRVQGNQDLVDWIWLSRVGWILIEDDHDQNLWPRQGWEICVEALTYYKN